MVPSPNNYIIAMQDQIGDSLKHAVEHVGYRTLIAKTLKAFKELTTKADISVYIVTHGYYIENSAYFEDLQAPCIVLIEHENVMSPSAPLHDSDPRAPWIVEYVGQNEKILMLIAKACIVKELRENINNLKSAFIPLLPQDGLIAVSPIMREILAKASVLAPYETTVLLTGESGTGKTALASYLHMHGPRRDKPFISLSCASIPRELLESELFGHEKGSFTGAISSRAGAFELADGGTLFLDEIGDLPIELQPKLLTVLQDKLVRRIGARNQKKFDVRIIVATNRNLKEMCERKEFREDLYFRLNVVNLHLPPLRDRREDIPALLQYTVNRLSAKLGRTAPKIAPSAEKQAVNHYWHGNIRELENIIERALVLSTKDTISVADLGLDASGSRQANQLPSLAGIPLSILEKRAIQDTLSFCKGNKKEAASLLQISLKTLYNKMKAS